MQSVEWKTGRVRFAGRRRRKVAIVCAGSLGVHAPVDDPTFEIWGLNGCDRWTRDASGRFRADRWFELHDLQEAVCRRRRPKGFKRWLSRLPIPVYQFHDRRDNALSVQFPIGRVIDRGRDYFGCTMCYQIGLAIEEGFQEIHLYGAELNHGREALVERPTTEWWTGFATGLGIKVVTPHGVLPGLGYHPYRYAFHQVQEREETFQFCGVHLSGNANYIASRAQGLA